LDPLSSVIALVIASFVTRQVSGERPLAAGVKIPMQARVTKRLDDAFGSETPTYPSSRYCQIFSTRKMHGED